MCDTAFHSTIVNLFYVCTKSRNQIHSNVNPGQLLGNKYISDVNKI